MYLHVSVSRNRIEEFGLITHVDSAMAVAMFQYPVIGSKGWGLDGAALVDPGAYGGFSIP